MPINRYQVTLSRKGKDEIVFITASSLNQHHSNIMVAVINDCAMIEFDSPILGIKLLTQPTVKKATMRNNPLEIALDIQRRKADRGVLEYTGGRK